MALNYAIPSFAAPIPPGYTHVGDAGGTGSTDISIKIEGSGNSGDSSGENPGEGDSGSDKPGGGDEGGSDSGDGDDDNDHKDGLYAYLIQYHYDDSTEREAGQGKLYDQIPYDMTTPKFYGGHNWMLERFIVSKFIVSNESDNTAELWYTIDDKDKDGNNVPGGDGIPDKYQDPDTPLIPAETFKYSVAYNFEQEQAGQIVEGQGTVGSIIPYSSPNTTIYNNKHFQLSKVSSKSNIVTPDESQNKIEIDYRFLNPEDEDDIPTDDNTLLYVTFDPNNGEKITTMQVPHGTSITTHNTPVKAGHAFLYWGIMDGDSYVEFDFNSAITANTALVAQYELEAGMVPYKVQHYKEQTGAEGEYPGYQLVAEENLLGTAGTEVTAIPRTYVGYKEDLTNINRQPSDMLSDDELVLKLFYVKDMVTVTIDLDNGTDMTVSEIPKNTLISAPSEPTKPGFEFDGWITDNKPMNFDKPITEDITIKAAWHKTKVQSTYKVEHYWENLTNNEFTLHETDTIEALESTTVRTSAKPYIGFTEDKANANRKDSGIVAADGSLTLKVFYTRNVYSVTIDPGNGNQPVVEHIKYGGTLEKPDDPIYDGHTTNGWKDKDTGAAVRFPMDITGDITITPIWTGNESKEDLYSYTITYHYDSQTEVVEGSAVKGTALPYATPASKVFAGKNYTFVNKQIKSETITNIAANNKADIYYELDEAGGHGTVNSGDGIPDRYQVVVHFKAKHGKLSHNLAVITKLDNFGNKSINGIARLSKSDIPTTTAHYGYRNGIWDTTPTVGLVVENGDAFTIKYFRIPSFIGGSSGGGSSHKPSGDNNSNSGSSNINKPDTNRPDESLADALLNKRDHRAYISGYPDGLIGPMNNITRGEVAQIIYSLLKDDCRDYYYTTRNSFTDMNESIWSNTAISTIANAGIVSGFPNGEFGYNQPITRAEFAAIVSRFTNAEAGNRISFTDIYGHWAEDYILSVAAAGWVNGYPDGGFHPNATLTRAEAVTILNYILERGADVEHMLKNMKLWPDNPTEAWFYEAIQEASNAHEFTKTKGVETWTKLMNGKNHL